MELNLIKCHGSNNDFLLIDEITETYNFSEKDRQNLAIALCDRKKGIGADGILFVMNSDRCDGKMRVFNADGSEASMCGNGLRCVGRYVTELKNKAEITIETLKADLQVSKEPPIYSRIPTYKVEISPVLFELEHLPMNLDRETLISGKVPEISDSLTFTAVAVPNPHLISIVENEHIISNEQKSISETVNGPNNLFPDGVNVSFVQSLGPAGIYVRTFERGVGFTNACGTAMSASTLVTCLAGMNEYEKEIDVYNNGGKVKVIVHKDAGKYSMDLIGNATYMASFKLEVDVKEPESFRTLNHEELEEKESYSELQEHAKEIVEENVFLKA
ncbi:diaminopimelate epimerase [Bacillus salacetis]|uniref:Diaminopimelate epimerase n=1 Tax=Bacillus salacetis TaxID=2315464 RepID=A0A3A1R6I9_9BACI|nr:diaminopimelate epimerase [Bacillus salacetis]RIW35107.1 diaminopimelate epimerase [Bacillus salacetis]